MGILKGIIEFVAMGVEIVNGTLPCPEGQEEQEEQEDGPVKDAPPLRGWDVEIPQAEYPE